MRTLQSHIRSSVRIQWVLAGVMALTTAGVYFLDYVPQNKRLNRLKNDAAQQQREIESAQARTKNLTAVAVQVRDLQVQLERWKRLPRQAELGEFLIDLTQLTKAATLRNVNLKQGVMTRSDGYSELPISLSFEADFLNAFTFLRNTEELKRLTRVKNLTVRGKDAKAANGQVLVQLSMSLFFAAE